MPDVVESVQKLLQDFVAPELRELRSELKSETKRLEDRIDTQAHQVQINFKRLEDKMDAGFGQLRFAIENANLRAELESTRDIANLRERVTRLEVERASQRQ